MQNMNDILLKIRHLFKFVGDADLIIDNKLVKYAFVALLAIISYIVTISIASTLITGTVVEHKINNDQYGSLTVEFFGSDGDVSGILTNKQKDNVLSVLNSMSGVKKAKNIDDSEMKNMLEKWLPGIEIPAGMPVPTLFSVELAGVNSVSAADITAELSKINKNVRIYDHSVINNDAVRLNGMFKMITIFSLILAVLMMCAAVYYFTNSFAASATNTIKILRSIGASKKYINDQIRSLNLSVFMESIAWSFTISLFTFISCYGILYPISIVSYVVICSVIMLLAPVVLMTIVIGVSSISVKMLFNNADVIA